MLAPRMVMGYGVAEAVAMQARGMVARGVAVTVGCLEADGHYPDVPTRRVAPDPDAVADLAIELGATAIVAHGSPYFEVLPELTGRFLTVAYEYGDPPPDLFGEDAERRRAQIHHKRTAVYPGVSEVAAISEFIRHDIQWDPAAVMVLGIEHVPDLGPKDPPRGPTGRLRVGSLMRLGPGEARYKGVDELRRLAAETPQLDWTFAGRGTDEDARDLRRAGFRTLLNPTDAQRTRFLRDLDVFVTLSEWEGTNLPLVEAAALGTPALALATAAHPEFTPLTFATAEGIADRLRRYDDDRQLLTADGRACYDWVRSRMSWETNSVAILALCAGAPDAPPPPRSRWSRRTARSRRFLSAIRERGWRETLTDQWRRRIG